MRDTRFDARSSEWIGDMTVWLRDHAEDNSEQLERLRRATAVFAVSDFYALDLMCFLSEHGLAVPDDISVAGFDDTPMCELVRPALTTVRQDAVLRAKLAVEKLRELREGKPVQPEYTLPVSLVVRGSTGPRCLSNHTILQT